MGACASTKSLRNFEAPPCFLKVLQLLLLVSGKPQMHVQLWGLGEVTNTGFPSGASGKESACQCRRCKRCGLSPWVGKIPWRKVWQPTPVFSPRESPWTEEPGRLQSMGLQRIRHDRVTKHSTAGRTGLCFMEISRDSVATLSSLLLSSP